MKKPDEKFPVNGMAGQYSVFIERYKKHIGIIAILLFAAIIRCYEITLPYCKPFETAFQEIIARNHIIYGFDQTHFLSVISVINGENIYHLNHQPLLQVLIALSYHVFGIHEWSARLIPIIFSLGSIILIYAIADRVWDTKTAIVATIFAAFMPMSAYFGRIVNFEPLVLFFVLFFAWAYLVWSETDNTTYYLLTILAVTFGALTDWPFFLILPLFLLLSLIVKKNVRKTGILFFFGCALAAGYLIIKTTVVGYESGVSNWFSHIFYRSNIPAYILEPELYSTIAIRVWNNYSLAIILAFIGLIIFVQTVKTRPAGFRNLSVKDLLPGVLLLFGLTYLAIFLESTYVHEYQMYYLIPGVALFAGFGLIGIFFRTHDNPAWNTTLRLIGVFLIILFLALSIQNTLKFHDTKRYEPYFYGSQIHEWTGPKDSISIIQVISPINFYANRSNIQNPTTLPSMSQIQTIKPKVIVFPPAESTDSSWDRTALVETLQKEDYHMHVSRPDFQIWVLNGSDVPDIAFRNADSIVVLDPITGNAISNSTQGYFFSGMVIDNQPALFEHPLLTGNIRANYIINIKNTSKISFGIGLHEKTWEPTMGDGVKFEIFCQSDTNETRIFSQYIDPKNNPEDRRWQYYTVPLDTCYGTTTTIGFATSPGPKNDNSYDWAYWINPIITTF